MGAFTFVLGFLSGLAALACYPLLKTLVRRLWYRLGEDEEYLLSAARAGRGRLILTANPDDPATEHLVLSEFPHQRPLQNLGQIDHLRARGLIQPDETKVPERFVLTPKGWIQAEKLPPLPLISSRQGAWYNSISRTPKQLLKGKNPLGPPGKSTRP